MTELLIEIIKIIGLLIVLFMALIVLFAAMGAFTDLLKDEKGKDD